VSETRKVGFVVRHADDEPETATLPFMIANGALAMNAEPVVILQGEGVRLGVKGYAERVSAEGLPALEPLLAALLDSGYRIMVCGPCMELRGYSEDDLRDGVFVGGAGKVVEAMLECANMLSY
jgi:uncharacterized protein involved in oxidation of intracellular sulfur